MSDKLFSRDLFEPIIVNEKIVESLAPSTNPYSFQSFIDNKKVEKSFTGATGLNSEQQYSFCEDQCLKQPIDIISHQEIHFSDENQFSNGDLNLGILSTTHDNPFSFRRFQNSHLAFSDINSHLVSLNTGNIDDNEDLLTSPTSKDNDFFTLQKENSDLRKSNFELLKEVEFLHKKNASLSQKLCKLHQKDSKEAKALEQVIKDVEANLDKANMRALSAENELDKVLGDYTKIKNSSNVKLHEYFEKQTERACTKLRLVTTEAEYFLNQLVLGVGNLKQTADFIESMHKLYESEM